MGGRLQILFYRTASGRLPAYEYIHGLPFEDVKGILGDLELVKQHGVFKAPVDTRQLDGKLWEIKSGVGHQQRLFYCLCMGDALVILHACKKQKAGSQQQDVEIARKRMKEIIL
jgi:phage-related protein